MANTSDPPPAGSSPPQAPHEAHPRPTLLSDFILGSQDGIVNVLGIILGLVAASTPSKFILVAALSALAAESIAMGAVAYTSTRSRRRLYLAEERREMAEMKAVPQLERQEVREILVRWGYEGTELQSMEDRICGNPKAWLEFMMAFELKLSPVEADEPRRSGQTVGAATVVGHLIPLLPFFVLGANIFLATCVAVVLSAAAFFATGWYEAKITLGVWWHNGSQMVIIGLGGGLAGYLIGWGITHLAGL